MDRINASASAEELKGENSEEVNNNSYIFPQKAAHTEAKLLQNNDIDVFGNLLDLLFEIYFTF